MLGHQRTHRYRISYVILVLAALCASASAFIQLQPMAQGRISRLSYSKPLNSAWKINPSHARRTSGVRQLKVGLGFLQLADHTHFFLHLDHVSRCCTMTFFMHDQSRHGPHTVQGKCKEKNAPMQFFLFVLCVFLSFARCSIHAKPMQDNVLYFV